MAAIHKDICKTISKLGNIDNKFWSRISLQTLISFSLSSDELVLLRNSRKYIHSMANKSSRSSA